MFTRLKWHFSGINTHFRPTISLFSTFFAVVSSPFSSISNVNISLPTCLLDRKEISSPFFSTVLYFGPKEAILRRLGNQNVILILPISAYGISKVKDLSCEQRICQRPTDRSLSVHSNSLRASAQSSSDMWKQTVCPVILRTIRER